MTPWGSLAASCARSRSPPWQVGRDELLLDSLATITCRELVTFETYIGSVKKKKLDGIRFFNWDPNETFAQLVVFTEESGGCTAVPQRWSSKMNKKFRVEEAPDWWSKAHQPPATRWQWKGHGCGPPNLEQKLKLITASFNPQVAHHMHFQKV